MKITHPVRLERLAVLLIVLAATPVAAAPADSETFGRALAIRSVEAFVKLSVPAHGDHATAEVIDAVRLENGDFNVNYTKVETSLGRLTFKARCNASVKVAVDSNSAEVTEIQLRSCIWPGTTIDHP